MEEVAIWKRRALKAEDLNRKFVAEINGPAYMGEPAQPTPSVPDEIERDAERACCGTFHGSRHRITCEKHKGKREPGDKP